MHQAGLGTEPKEDYRAPIPLSPALWLWPPAALASRRHDNQRSPLSLAVVLALACSLTGCGGSPSYPETCPTTGLVTFGGQPLTAGVITYAPVNAQEQRPASGQINADGEFSLSTFRPGDGAMPGNYRVSVVAYPGNASALRAGGKTGARKPVIPNRYSKAETSGLGAAVTSGTNRHQFPLEP